jgi:hypothetical protein
VRGGGRDRVETVGRRSRGADRKLRRAGRGDESEVGGREALVE